MASLLLLACGNVTENGDGDGDAGQDCAGTVDNDGNCICPPRQVAPECACAAGWGGDDCEFFTDDFNRAAGALGPIYDDITLLPGVQDALVINNRACGDVQSVGLLTEVLDSPRISAQVSFDPGSLEGQELNLIMSDDDDLQSFFLAGCDGGGGNCTLRIGELNQLPLAEEGAVNPMPAGMLHRFELNVDGANNISLRLTIAGGGGNAEINTSLPAGYNIRRFGFVVGREPDSINSCIDDLAVQVN